jgi:DNA-binding response OmpR family regulator
MQPHEWRGTRSVSLHLHGAKVLIVEDETLISFLIEDMLHELGCAEIWHAAAVKQALAILDDRCPDVALLDVNLGHELVYPLAARLEEEQIPFVFATGYGRKGLAERWSDRPVVQKPFAREALEAALGAALRNGSAAC